MVPEKGRQPPFSANYDSGERCKLNPQLDLGRIAGRRRVFVHSVPPDCLSRHLSTCCIQFVGVEIHGLHHSPKSGVHVRCVALKIMD